MLPILTSVIVGLGLVHEPRPDYANPRKRI